MIYETHSESINSVCKKCSAFVCSDCILSNHANHLQSIIFIDNIILIAYRINQILDELKSIMKAYFNQNSHIMSILKDERQFYREEVYQIFEYTHTQNQLTIFMSIINQIIFKKLLLLISKESLDEEKQKELKIIILELTTVDDERIIKLNYNDLYYFLLNSQQYQKATQIQNYMFQHFAPKSVFFKQIIQNLHGSDIQLNQHSQILLGRNYFYVNKFQKCAQLLEDFKDNEEALIYSALSFYCLQKYDEANEMINNLQCITNNRQIVLFIKCFVLCELANLTKPIEKLEEYIEELCQIIEQLHPILFKFEAALRYHICIHLNRCNVLINLTTKIQRCLDKLLIYNFDNFNETFYKLPPARPQSVFGGRSNLNLENTIIRLVQLEPKNIKCYMLLGYYLIQTENFTEFSKLSNYLNTNFEQTSIVKLLSSINLFLQNKFRKGLELFEKVEFQCPYEAEDLLIFQLAFLFGWNNLPLAFKALIKYKQGRTCTYCVIEFFCCKVNLSGLNEEAINLTKGYMDPQSQDEKQFYQVLLGRLLLDKGITLKDDQFIYESLSHLTITENILNPNIRGSLSYYRGNALLRLGKIEEALVEYETALKCQFFGISFYTMLCLKISICKFMTLHFDQALFFYDKIADQSHLTCFKYVYYGLWNWIKGDLNKAAEFLNQIIIDEQQIFKFLLCWIQVEQDKENKESKTKTQLSSLLQDNPQVKLFCQKETFAKFGVYTNYLKNNLEKFQNVDDKIYFAVKYFAIILDSAYEAPIYCTNQLFAHLIKAELDALTNEKHFIKVRELINGYPFL